MSTNQNVALSGLTEAAADVEKGVSHLLASEYGVARTGDYASHAADLAAELMRVLPHVVAEVAVVRSAGGTDQDISGTVAPFLTALVEQSPNCIVGADSTKALARIVYRRFVPGDQASADEWARRDDVTTARRQTRAMADKLGLRLVDLRVEAEELYRSDLERAARIEAERKAKIASDRRKREAETRRQLGFTGNDFLKGIAKN